MNSSGDYSTGAAQIIMPHVVGTLEVYEQQTVWPVVAKNTELLVFWGADPMTTNQISSASSDHGAYDGPGRVQGHRQEGHLHRSGAHRDLLRISAPSGSRRGRRPMSR